MNVRTLCLGILSMREATGYEIRKMVEEGVFSHFIDASYGSIYPALARMLKEGLVQVRSEPGEQGRPARKVYSITPRGQAALDAALATDPARDKFKSEFLFQMMFARRIDPDHLAVIYDAYIEEQERELQLLEEEVQRCPPEDPGARFVADYGRAMLGTAIAFLKERREEVMRAFAGDNRTAQPSAAEPADEDNAEEQPS